MAKILRKSLLVFALSFSALFIIRLSYGFLRYPTYEPAQTGDANGFFYAASQDASVRVRNIATAKMKIKDGGTQALTVDQKYEKVSTISSRTEDFDGDDSALREQIAAFNALIQFESNTGLKGGRVLEMAIGVQPDSFDAMVDAVRKIGVITSFAVNKTDKTNEYKDLLAKKRSLEQTRNSLIALKSRGGAIDEFIALENRILEVEEKLQDLGVSLGEFDAENEFCTVNFTLAEKAKGLPIPFIQRVMVALVWTIKYYLLLVGGLLLVTLLTLAALALAEKLKLLAKLPARSG